MNLTLLLHEMFSVVKIIVMNFSVTNKKDSRDKTSVKASKSQKRNHALHKFLLFLLFLIFVCLSLIRITHWWHSLLKMLLTCLTVHFPPLHSNVQFRIIILRGGMVRYITLTASSVRYVHNSIIRANARFRDSLPQTRPTRGKCLFVFSPPPFND